MNEVSILFSLALAVFFFVATSKCYKESLDVRRWMYRFMVIESIATLVIGVAALHAAHYHNWQ